MTGQVEKEETEEEEEVVVVMVKGVESCLTR
jgi:hypothetical protein